MKTYLLKTNRGYLVTQACCEHCLNYKLSGMFYKDETGENKNYEIYDVLSVDKDKSFLFLDCRDPYIICSGDAI